MTSAPAAQDVDLVRSKLERSLKGSGTLDVIKTQVRGYLLQEIKRQGLGSATPRAEVSLEQRAADSLVLDHLRASRYSYTLSIFASESGLTEDALPPREACSVFELPEPCVAPTPPSPAGSTGGTQLDGQSALLSTLTGLTESRLSPSRHAVETTALTPPPAEPPLEEKLRSLDRALEARLKEDSPSGTSQAALEEQMLRVQRETDARAAATLNAEVQRLRQVETVTIRKQEQAAARVAVEEAAAEQQQWYERQQARLREAEEAAIDSRRAKEAALEASGLELRQQAMVERENVRARLAQQSAELEARGRELAAERELMRQERLLVEQAHANTEKARELAHKQAQDELLELRRQQQQEHAHTISQLESSQQELREERLLVQQERERCQAQLANAGLAREHLDEARNREIQREDQLAELSSELRTVRAQLASGIDESAELKARALSAEEALESAQARLSSLRSRLAEAESNAHAREQQMRHMLEASEGAAHEKATQLEEARREAESVRRMSERELRHALETAADAEAKLAVAEKSRQAEHVRATRAEQGVAVLRSSLEQLRSVTAAGLGATDTNRAVAIALGGASDALHQSTAGGRDRSGVAPPPSSSAAFAHEAAHAGHAGDVFTHAFEESARRLRELDQQKAMLENKCRAFLTGSGGATLRLRSSVPPAVPPPTPPPTRARQAWCGGRSRLGRQRRLRRPKQTPRWAQRSRPRLRPKRPPLGWPPRRKRGERRR